MHRTIQGLKCDTCSCKFHLFVDRYEAADVPPGLLNLRVGSLAVWGLLRAPETWTLHDGNISRGASKGKQVTFVPVPYKCPAHEMLSDAHAWNAVRGDDEPGTGINGITAVYGHPRSENLRKNLAFGFLAQTKSLGLCHDVTTQEGFNEDGSPNMVIGGLALDDDLEMGFRFTGTGAARRLDICVRGRVLTADQKTAIHAGLDSIDAQAVTGETRFCEKVFNENVI